MTTMFLRIRHQLTSKLQYFGVENSSKRHLYGGLVASWSTSVVEALNANCGQRGHHAHTFQHNLRLCTTDLFRNQFRPLGHAAMSSSSHRSKAIMARDELKGSQLKELFDSTYLQVVADISSQFKHKQLDEVKSWLLNVIDYNLHNGKRNRATSLVLAYDRLSTTASDDNIRAACILGWCIELLQAHFLVEDDIMDDSITRRGQLCWFRKENVGMIAINDGLMLNNCIYELLNKYFSSHPCYVDMIHLFHEITTNTTHGQCLDLITNLPNTDLSKCTEERYSAIVQYKTAYYTFCLPIRLAMYMANISEPQTHQKAETILLKIGHLFQAQDDHLDCFGDPKVTGKIGTDIEDGKCCWPLIKALTLANPEQKELITANYGIHSKENVSIVKSIYQELNIDDVFRQYEQNQFDEICNLIEQIDDKRLSKDIFYSILGMIYQRQK